MFEPFLLSLFGSKSFVLTDWEEFAIIFMLIVNMVVHWQPLVLNDVSIPITCWNCWPVLLRLFFHFPTSSHSFPSQLYQSSFLLLFVEGCVAITQDYSNSILLSTYILINAKCHIDGRCWQHSHSTTWRSVCDGQSQVYWFWTSFSSASSVTSPIPPSPYGNYFSPHYS